MAHAGFAGRMDGAVPFDRAARIARLRQLAVFLDAAVRLPGGIRVGADSILGLAPGVGDALTALLGAYIVVEAGRLGVPRHKLVRMAVNLGIDSMVGAVPVVGDLFDVAFRANLRNLQIIEDHFAAAERASTRP